MSSNERWMISNIRNWGMDVFGYPTLRDKWIRISEIRKRMISDISDIKKWMISDVRNKRNISDANQDLFSNRPMPSVNQIKALWRLFNICSIKFIETKVSVQLFLSFLFEPTEFKTKQRIIFPLQKSFLFSTGSSFLARWSWSGSRLVVTCFSETS